MKILETTDVSKWSHILVCHGCDSKLEIVADDLISHHWDGDAREPAYDSYSIICPVCRGNVAIEPTKIPKLIKVNIKNKGKN